MRFVPDTDVVVAGFRSDRGASRALLLAALDHRFVLLTSVALMLEYEAVLRREEQLQEIWLTAAEVNAALDAIAAVSEPIQLRFLWRPLLKDPADEMVLETAVNGRADCLVTFNERHFGPVATSFGLRVSKPGQVLRELEEKSREKK